MKYKYGTHNMVNHRIHMPQSDDIDSSLAPKHLTKQQFGNRLYRLMMAKGWTQSELARQSELTRDSISTYVRGRALPTPQSLAKLAAAFGVKPEDLLPNTVKSAIEADDPAFELRQSTNTPGKVWLRLNRMVSMASAVKIAEIIYAEDDDRI